MWNGKYTYNKCRKIDCTAKLRYYIWLTILYAMHIIEECNIIYIFATITTTTLYINNNDIVITIAKLFSFGFNFSDVYACFSSHENLKLRPCFFISEKMKMVRCAQTHTHTHTIPLHCRLNESSKYYYYLLKL